MTTKQIIDHYAIVAVNANKLIMVVISIAGSMAITSVPVISELLAKNKLKDMRDQLSNNIQLFFFIMFPAVIGMAVVSKPLYTVFYGYSAFGTSILQWSSYMSLFLGLFVLFGSTLQAINQTKAALMSLFIGLVVKLITQFPLLYLFQTHGMLLSNILGFGVTIYLMLLALNKIAPLAIKPLAKQLSLIVLVTLAMSLIVFVVQLSMYQLFDHKNRLGALFNVGISATIGGFFYLYMTLKIRLADRLLGNRIEGLRRKLKIK